MIHAAIIGFGEAGQAFADDQPWPAFDIDPAKTRSGSLAEALKSAKAILSLVTADAAMSAVEAAAPHIATDAFFFDMNSVSPDSKRESAKVIAGAGGRYIDVAVMSPVHQAKRATPLLLSASHAEAGLETLLALGFTNVRVVGDDVGRASSIKMIRSIMIKGLEALTAEMMLAAERAGVTDEVLASLGDGWASKADYNLERMRTHGQRRAAEMEEVAKTLSALDIVPVMTSGTIQRQREMAE
jgi:3-hydroxyisobutyrate dehydrogenase-like beta-hydroxyacid dehydrogenase